MNLERLLVVGAGPVGLHAALHAEAAGFDVSVLERDDIGSAVQRWSHVRLFTPFSMNSTRAGRQAAGEESDLPHPDELLTGADYVARYLRPLGECRELSGRIRTRAEVVAVSRRNFGKQHHIRQPERADSPFRILLRGIHGQEEIVECDVLLDCTGFTSRHRFIGAGGIPCPGERDWLKSADYEIVDPARPVWREAQHVVVIGSGYSAATSVCLLHDAGLRTTWITRGDRSHPVLPVENDSLLERRSLTNRANDLACREDAAVTWLPGPLVDVICKTSNGLQLTMSMPDGRQKQIVCDRIVANPGYRPDSRPFEELQIDRCYATEGPVRLAAHLLDETAGDCLNQTAACPDLLQNPEPGFFIVGAASYGRDSRFLLQNGLRQVEQIVESILAGREVLQ